MVFGWLKNKSGGERHQRRSLGAYALAAACAVSLLFGANTGARAEDPPSDGSWTNGYVTFHNIVSACNGECGFQVYGGKFVDDSMKSIFGLQGFTPIWDWQWADSGIIAVAVSRPIVTLGDDIANIEGELGAAKRFGDATSAEVWAALFFNWKWFPWNHFVKTQIGVSTGLNYAFKLDQLEVVQAGNGVGSKLLHFLTPEIAFSLPQSSFPNVELVFRFHHRSGGKKFLLGDTKLFNSTAGGAQYATVGVRWRF